MNEQHFAYRLRQHLNRGLHELPAGTAARLEAARADALAHQKVAAHQSVLASIGDFAHHHLDNLHPRQLLAACAVLACVGLYVYWDAAHNIAQLEEIDSALLADDLPIDAFTDKGFHAWLKSSPAQ